jgi:hypothetical protein
LEDAKEAFLINDIQKVYVTAKRLVTDTVNYIGGDDKDKQAAGASFREHAYDYIGLGMMLATRGREPARPGATTNFFRGAKPGTNPSFVPRPSDFKIDSSTGFVKDTHGVSIFDNAESVLSKGFEPHQLDLNSMPDTLRVIQRGGDPYHFEIVPQPGANLTPQQFINACTSIVCK